MNRVGLHETQIKRIRQIGPMLLGQFGMFFRVQPDIQQGARPAPCRIGRAGTHRQKRGGAEYLGKPAGIGHLPCRNGAHGIARQRHGPRHRQIKPDQTLQAFGPPAMPIRIDRRIGVDLRIIGKDRMFLHCGNPFTVVQHSHVAIRVQRKPGGAARARSERIRARTLGVFRQNERVSAFRSCSDRRRKGRSRGYGRAGSAGCGAGCRCRH